jgi:Asp-tRNA(Asn)/Glu-tRNA(Gln) amidotransferase C subunit
MKNQEIDSKIYVEQMALLVDLDLREEYKDGVIANFERIQNIAKVVNEFDLPAEIEAAPIFEP